MTIKQTFKQVWDYAQHTQLSNTWIVCFDFDFVELQKTGIFIKRCVNLWNDTNISNTNNSYAHYSHHAQTNEVFLCQKITHKNTFLNVLGTYFTLFLYKCVHTFFKKNYFAKIKISAYQCQFDPHFYLNLLIICYFANHALKELVWICVKIIWRFQLLLFEYFLIKKKVCHENSLNAYSNSI